MNKIALFGEDDGHEQFLTALLKRLAHEYNVAIKVIPRSVRGGHGKALLELQTYLKNLQGDPQGIPDMIIVATDANCEGYQKRKQEIEKRVPPEFKDSIICAIPDPHIERWLLLDSSAFKTVLGKGCNAPDYKCERDRYKRLLIEAIQDAGLTPLIGGIEHTEDIVNQLNLIHVAKADESIKKLLKELSGKFKEWSKN